MQGELELFVDEVSLDEAVVREDSLEAVELDEVSVEAAVVEEASVDEAVVDELSPDPLVPDRLEVETSDELVSVSLVEDNGPDAVPVTDEVPVVLSLRVADAPVLPWVLADRLVVAAMVEVAADPDDEPPEPVVAVAITPVVPGDELIAPPPERKLPRDELAAALLDAVVEAEAPPSLGPDSLLPHPSHAAASRAKPTRLAAYGRQPVRQMLGRRRRMRCDLSPMLAAVSASQREASTTTTALTR